MCSVIRTIRTEKAKLMKGINQESFVNIKFEMQWKSSRAVHTEIYETQGLNIWRDCMPETLLKQLVGKSEGETITTHFEPGVITSGYDPGKTFAVKLSQFNQHFIPDKTIEPRIGRFYPKGLLKGVTGVFPQNLQPFRCVGIENGVLKVDFNHPLADKKIQLNAFLKKTRLKFSERGGVCSDWMEIMADGPGMQSRWKGQPTDFLSENPFQREDDGSDLVFYKTPRLVQHLDDRAIEVVTGLYGLFIHDGMRVLDLMSSWKSHLPTHLKLDSVTGLGMNQEELANNEQLTNHLIHDLNQSPQMPFDDNQFDAILCTVSVEYLTQPFEVFAEVARILKPEGYFITTFSNRWFPPKVINIWPDLHEFERQGMVMEYFLQSGKYHNLQTYSARNFPRPNDDKYIHETAQSDPVFAVWGQKI